MKKIILYIIFVSLILYTAISCNKNSVILPEEDQPGRRDYTWTIDTVVSPENYPYKTLLRLWGSSPTDLWATAGGGNFAADIFHYDGFQWVTGGKYIIPWAPYSIYGFAPNDVYIGCEAGRIYHFDGNNMKEVAALTKDEHSDIVFDNIWGESPNDIYAFGAYPDDELLANKSVVAHLNNNWTIISTDGLIGIVEHLYKNKPDDKVYLQVIKFSNTYDSTFIYEYNQQKYIELYSLRWSQHWASISFINDNVYFILNTKISVRVKDQFQTVLDLNNTNFYERVWGRNSKDIFLEMTDGLAHYNGSNIEYLFHYNQSNVSIFGAALFESEVFFLVNEFETGLSLIYHGRINE